MSLDDFLRIGQTVDLGSHTFQADEIKAFAAKYDPQRFHLDEAEAEKSVFGRLCASGWHTCAMWMRYNLQQRGEILSGPWTGPGEKPEFGPAAGIANLKWLKPVYVGETIRFTRTATGHRALASKPGWHMVSIMCEAFDGSGDKVVEFESSLLLRA